jgi:hypothetical protein
MLAPDERPEALQVAAGLASCFISLMIPVKGMPTGTFGYDLAPLVIPHVTGSQLTEGDEGFAIDRDHGWDSETAYKTWAMLLAEYLSEVRTKRGTKTSVSQALEVIVRGSMEAVKSGKATTPWFPR